MSEQSVATRITGIRDHIARSCERSGRSLASVHLIGASKRQPLRKIEAAIAAGLLDLGENRVQEAHDKQEQLAPSGADRVRWHLFGPLQSNKAKLAGTIFDSIHSLERFKIATILDRQAGLLSKRIDIFLQINLGGESRKAGIPDPQLTDRPARDLIPLVEPFQSFEHLHVVGLMAIPPFERDPERSRRWFQRLRDLADTIGDAGIFPQFPAYLSMGMSRDFHIAIEEGATHVRVGTALFGSRPEPESG